MATPEKLLETRILDWLNSIEDCFAFKINSMGVYDAKRKTWRKNNNPHIHNGISDILFCCSGRFGAIEVKIGSNKPSPNQKKYIARVLDSGGVAWWTKDYQDCKREFMSHFPDMKYKDKPLFDEVL
jgi:hypothetical protein